MSLRGRKYCRPGFKIEWHEKCGSRTDKPEGNHTEFENLQARRL